MKIHQLKYRQLIRANLEETWNFFSNPGNLPNITPPSLRLTIISEFVNEIYSGLLVFYKVTPVLGISQTWVTEITHVIERNYFVDEQRFGPYRFWHHQHHFKAVDNGVEMTDIVTYALHFDPLSRFFNKFMVRNRLEEIFEFRKKKVRELFG